MNIFFFGGSFDPPHKAHKLIYKNCINLCDKFIFVPSNQSPGKDMPKAKPKIRIEMLNSIIEKEDRSKVLIDLYEINSGLKPNFTIDTIKHLKDKYKNATLNMVIGQDQYENIKNWHDSDKILQLVKIICFNRKNKNNKNNKNNDIDIIDFNINISSTQIRKKIAIGQFEDIKNFITEDTINIIKNNNLYEKL